MSIVDKGNRMLSKLYFSNIKPFRFTSDCVYNLACTAYIKKHKPSPSYLDETIDKFAGDVSEDERNAYRKKLMHDWNKYGCAIDEYFLYNFDQLNDKEKREYISDVERLKYASILNDRKSSRIFKHKYQTYLLFEKFYKRDIIRAGEIDKSFIEKHPRFIYKVEDGNRGFGVQILDANDYGFDPEKIKRSIENWESGICEELIVQDDSLAQFHPGSVNTVRMFTLKNKKGEVLIWCGVLRMGRGDAIVDNGFTGALYADIDCETGILRTDGVTENGEHFDYHPDSNIKIKGFHIPAWEEFKTTVTEMAKVIPDVNYVGWDLAFSDKGWVMVEGNSFGQLILSQSSSLIPLKKQFFDFILG